MHRRSSILRTTTAALLLAGCAGAHAAEPVTTDLVCAPAQLRSAWWSDGSSTFYGRSSDLTIQTNGDYAWIRDDFRSVSVSLSDGTTSDPSVLASDLPQLAGARYAAPRMLVDAMGRSDYAGVTDVLSVGTTAPLAAIPWIVPRDATGYTQVATYVPQSGDRAYLVERALHFGQDDRGTWLRVVSLSSTPEIRMDLSAHVTSSETSLGSGTSLLVDEARGIVVIPVGLQAGDAPHLVRIDPATADLVDVPLEVGADAPLLGMATIGAPRTQLLDAALSSDGLLLAVTTRDGRLRVFDATTLAPIGIALGVGVGVANPDTYLPTLRSPVALSSHGQLLASLDAEGRVTLTDVATATRLTTLASVAPDQDGALPHPPRPMAIRFLADGVLVVTDSGIERYRCE